MTLGVRYFVALCVGLGLWYALRRLGLSKWRAWAVMALLLAAVGALVQFAAGSSASYGL